MVSDHQPVQEASEVGSAAALATVAVGSEEEEVSEVDMAAVAGMAGEAESATDMADQEALPQVREVVGTEAVEGGTAAEEAAAAATMTVDRATQTMSLCHLVVEAAIVTAMGDLGVAMAAGKRGRMMVVGMTIRGPGSDDTSRRHQVVRPPTEE